MAEAQLRLIVGMATADERPVPVALDAVARRRLVDIDLDDLEPHIDTILEYDLTGLADASLLAATLLYRTRRGRSHLDRAMALAGAAHDRYVDTNDDAGLTLACLLLGHLAWWAGDTPASEGWWDAAAGLPVDGNIPAGLASFRALSDLLTEGRLKTATAESHVAHAVTVAEGSVTDEAHATLLGGLLMIDNGKFDRAAGALERADDLFAEICPVRDAALWPGVAIGLAEIAAARGDIPLAMAQYVVAERRADDLGQKTLAKLARALPALTLRGQRHPDFLDQAKAAEVAIRADESHWYLRQVAERTLATAHLEAGDASRALEIVEVTAATAPNVLIRAKTLLIVARARRALGLDGVAAALDEAAATFLAEGADLWAVEALLELAVSRPADASTSLEIAYLHTGDDAAFRRLWGTRPTLHIELGAGERPRFVVDGTALALGTKGERLAEVVARAGDAGIHWETAARALWPAEDDSDRIKSRLTSLTALVRHRLGAEGWRLRRDGPCFSFVTLAADVVVHPDPSRTRERPGDPRSMLPVDSV